jgi:hypothetical protein
VELYLHSPDTPSWHGAELKKQRTTLPYTICMLGTVIHALNDFCEHVKQVGKAHRDTVKVKVKGKVVSVLFLNEHHAMKAYWGSGVIAPLIICPRH